ncbi:hypothetical protein [Aquisediminimonas profunda]|uniref:hypothetical protein n=1 Tax=Aquisediminimonas profunda TaxID=1550733 RepID=UPI001C625955|nr:hypothetical protein [Aquisediminimonas profunda]
MSDNGAFTAIERIERALARIEAATAQTSQSRTNDLALAEMTARHRALSEETRRAVADLDLLLSGISNG